MKIETKVAILASGKVRNVEYKVSEKGCPILTFGLKYAKDPNEPKKHLFLNCKCFYEKAKAYQYLSDGMEILVCGEKQSREYNGKIYEDVLVDLICMGLIFAMPEEEEVYEEDSDSE